MSTCRLASAGCVVGAALVSAQLLSGCASLYQKRSVTGSGFLNDYSQMTNRGGDTALLSYVAPVVTFSKVDGCSEQKWTAKVDSSS